MPELPVVVVGGGLAGMSAALTLHEAGVPVELLERRPSAGGRAGSFHSPVLGGRLLDNSPHVLLGCCGELLSFYQRLGVQHHVRFSRQTIFSDAAGRRSVISASPLPSPLHLLPSLLGFRILSLRQRLEVISGMLHLAAVSQRDRAQFANTTFAALLRQWRQSPQIIERFWNIICVSALNEPCETAAAHFAIQVFQETFLAGRWAYQLGLLDVPLSRLYESLPFPVRYSAQVKGVVVESGRVTAVAAEANIPCRAVVLAVHPRRVAALLPESLRQEPEIARLAGLEYAPIIGVHLLYDRPILDVPHLALVGTHLQWLFADAAEPALLHGVVSAPGDLVKHTQEDLLALFDREARQVCGAAASARLCGGVAVKLLHATFRPITGVEQFRPRQTTGIPGLFLAGDYTQTRWPSTMEGAVISGRLAAEALLQLHCRS